MVDSKSYIDWIEAARKDLKGAEILYKAGGVEELVAFHCQQSVEKYLKAFLIKETGILNHAFEGNNCKHMAAVLYSAEYEDIDEDLVTNDTVETNMEISITELVEEADENIIRNFLISALEKDEKLLNRFKNTGT